MILKFLLVFCLSLITYQPAQAAMQEIAAVVNADAISMRDLNKRIRLVMVSSGLPNNKEIRQRLTPQVLSGLVNEALMLQEAADAGITIPEEDVDRGFAAIAQQNKLAAAKFKNMLRKSGVDVETLRNQVRAQLAWKEFVQSKLRNRVVISERDIDDAYERISSKIGSTEYLTAEIFLPTDDAQSEAEAEKLVKRLRSEIRSGRASFFKLAQQFSKAAGSANGGDNGWLNETQMDPALLEAVQKIKKNQVSKPVKTLNGHHILFLRDTRQVSEKSLPSRDQIAYTLGSQRLDKVQRRHLQDIKALSFVDIRV